MRALACGDEQGIIRFHDHKIGYPNRGDKFTGSVNVISPGIQLESSIGRDEIAIGGVALGGMVLVESRPGAEIVPSEVRRQAKNIR